MNAIDFPNDRADRIKYEPEISIWTIKSFTKENK